MRVESFRFETAVSFFPDSVESLTIFLKAAFSSLTIIEFRNAQVK